MKFILEIQAGEGGEDSKLFVEDLFSAYLKYMTRKGIKAELLYKQHGKVGVIAHDAEYL